MADEEPREAATYANVVFLRSLADRLAMAIYNANVGPLPGISTGLRYDDGDRLRELAKRLEIEDLMAQLAAAKARKP